MHGIYPGPGTVPDFQVLQRHGHPGNLVAGRGVVTAAIGHDHAADRDQPLGGDHVPGPGFPPGLANRRQPQVTARAVILTIVPPVDTVATSKDAEPGRLLQATAWAGLPWPGLAVLLPLMRLAWPG